MFYLKLKDAGSRHCYYCNLEESAVAPHEQFMDVHKAKYAEGFDTRADAQKFKGDWDTDDSFEIVENLG